MPPSERPSPRELADQLHDAIYRGNDQRVAELLSAGADPRLPYLRTGWEALEIAEALEIERPGRWKGIIRQIEEAKRRLGS
ncbi:MAG: hypothetical protein R2909_08345 [Gemmatimonadales bacterium]